MENERVNPKQRSRVLNWSEVRHWKNPYDPERPPPVFRLPRWTVSKLLLLMTIAEPTIRGGTSILETAKEAKEEK